MQHKPFDIETEKALLCAMLRESDCIEAALSIAGIDDFSSAHQPIYKAIIDLFQSGSNPDLITVINALKSSNELEACGGHVYLSDLTNQGAIGKNARTYAELIRKKADARRAKESIKNILLKVSGNGTDPQEQIGNLIQELQIIHQPPVKTVHNFEPIGEGGYRLSIDEISAEIEVDRLRRNSAQDLMGELFVRCSLPGVSTYEGTISAADFNLSSARARAERARLLDSRSNVNGIDWTAYLEEFCQRALMAERKGQPSVDLRTIERPKADDALRVAGLTLPRRHPTICFGDGGSAKSYLGLYLIGLLAQQGMRVGLFDWELAGEEKGE